MGDKRNDKFMKFGPDWLHNLSQDNSTPVTAASTTAPAGPPTSATAAPPTSASKPRGPSNNISAPPNHKDFKEKDVKDLKDFKDPKDFKDLKDFKNNNSRCRLADHRYGREEMLALFDGNVSPPNDLTNNEELFVNRAQLPLALQAESAEDESNRRNNWPARNAPPKVGPSNMGLPNAGSRPAMGKQQEFPSQRGRSKPAYYYNPEYYSNGRGRGGLPRDAAVGMEPGEWENGGTFYNTRKDFNNGNYGSRSMAYTRKGPEANLARGMSDPPDGENPAPYNARKDYTGGYHRGHDANWRRNYGRTTEEEDAWRASGEGPGPRLRPSPSLQQQIQQMQQPPHFGKKLSWRDEDAEREAHMERGMERRPPLWANNRKTWAGDSHSPDDLLPEWANPDNTAIPSGSFDSSGAFHEEESELQHSQSATTVFDKKVPLTRVFSQGNIRSKPSTGAGSFMRAISKGIDPPVTSASNAKVFNATDIDFLNKKKNEVKVESKVEKAPDVAELQPNEQQEANSEQEFEPAAPSIDVEIIPDPFQNQHSGSVDDMMHDFVKMLVLDDDPGARNVNHVNAQAMAGASMPHGIGAQMIGAQMIGSQMVGAQMVGAQMPGGQMSGGQMPGGKISGGQMSGGQMPGGQMPGGQMPGGQMPGGQMPGGQMPGGQMPGGQMSGGQMSGVQMPMSGQLGMPGQTGMSSSSGMPSASGISGASGMPGSSGLAGASGMSGAAGLVGASGIRHPMMPPGLDPMGNKHNNHHFNLESTKVPLFPSEGTNWFYRDPQGDVQGPFTSAEMADWFDSGYFSSTLFIRRGCDFQFVMLGQMITLCGGYIPFLLPKNILSKVYDSCIPPEEPPPQPMNAGFPQYQMRGMMQPPQVHPPQMGQFSMNQMAMAGDGMQQQQPPMQMDYMGDWAAAAALNAGGVYWQPGHPPPTYPHPGMMVPPPLRPEFMHQPQMPVQSVWDMQEPKQKPLVLEQLFSNIQQHPSTLNEPQVGVPNQQMSAPMQPQQDRYMPMYPNQQPTFMNLFDVEQQQVEAMNLQPQVVPLGNQMPPSGMNQMMGQADMPANMMFGFSEPQEQQPMVFHVPPPNQAHIPREFNMHEPAYALAVNNRSEPLPIIYGPVEVSPHILAMENEPTETKEPKQKKTDSNKTQEKKKQEEPKKKAENEKKKNRKEETENVKVETKVESVKKKQKQMIAKLIPEMVLEKPVERDIIKKATHGPKLAPWCAAREPIPQLDSLSLAQIQRMERENKHQQIRDMQQMMADQELADAEHREMQMQVMKLRWVDHKLPSPQQVMSLADIQAEEQHQLALIAKQMAAAAKLAVPEKEIPPINILAPSTGGIWGPPTPAANNVSWWQAPQGASNWDTPATAMTSSPPKNLAPFVENPPLPIPKPAPKHPEKSPAPVQNVPVNNAAPAPTKPLTKRTGAIKKEVAEKKPVAPPPPKVLTEREKFLLWVKTSLNNWSSQVDVPVFMSFLQSLEAPYEVKEYARFYLGDTRESADFARQYTERRSKLLRTNANAIPSDDLCAPAAAVNPGVGTDFQDAKGKGRRNKKNKMLKIDSRILGFNVTAAEDRFNVGELDNV